MKCIVFTCEPGELENCINKWLTSLSPIEIEILHCTQSESIYHPEQVRYITVTIFYK